MNILRCLLMLACLGLLWGGSPGLHSLRYFFSCLSETLPGVPQYSVVGYVDDVLIIGYNSESRRAGPRAAWMEKITDFEPWFWEENTETFQDVKKTLNDSLRNLMEEKKQSPGLHVLQMMLGCELHKDGSVKWFEQYAYDGSNLPGTTDSSAEPQDRGNSNLCSDCMTELKKLLKYGKESLLRKVTPQKMVSLRKHNNRTFLFGYAYGFYPREIEVKWSQNGVEIPCESSELLPNPNGTYQVRTTVEVQEGDDARTYEFRVNHSSLPEIVTITYGPHGRSWSVWWVLLVLVSVVVVVMAAVIWKLEHLKHYFTSGSSTGSDTGSSTSKGLQETVEMMKGDASVI